MQRSFGADAQDTPLRALQRAIDQDGDRVFVDMAGEILTYRELDIRSTRLANSLATLGVGPGKTVVSILESSLDVFAIWFAVNKLGAIWVPINLAYEREFLRHQIDDSGAVIAICDATFLDRLVTVAPGIPTVQLILCRGLAETPECPIPIASFDAHRGSDDTPIPHKVKPADLAFLVYTSGTTGPSKGCMLSHNLLCMLARQQIAAIPHGQGERTWTCLPLFHMSALTATMGALVAGNGVAMAPRFSVTHFWDEIERSKATNALLMATIFPLIAHAPDNDAMKRCFGQLKMTSGVPVSPDVRRIWQERFGVGFVNTFAYGQTEGCRLSTHELGDPVPPEGSAGKIAGEFELMIFDDDDQPLPDGTIGEIVYRPRAPHVMFEGYWRRPEETLRVWSSMWMHTGDLGKVENGYLFFCDRKKDYLRSRGENISSFEVEKTYTSHPDILEVAVHAVGAKAADDEIKVSIVLKEGATLTEEACCHWSIANLPHFAVPRYYEFRVALPKNPTGRVLKYALRDEGVTPSTWDRTAAGIEVRRKR
jgi:crotonobetaine/carnitine-CoA ligase